MKILYISPENTVGTLNLWRRYHEEQGNECQIITFYRTRFQDDPGICLDLPLVYASNRYMNFRHRYYQLNRGTLGDYAEKAGHPPVWRPESFAEKWYFHFSDWLWHFTIEPAIKQYNLLEYDIYHFEWGMDFYRDERFARRVAEAGKPIVCTYHGQDMRTRGVFPFLDRVSGLNLTSELDLLEKHPDLTYMFLPFDTGQFQPRESIHAPLRVCHSPTNRYYKGSDDIIPVCRKLEQEGLIQFILLEGLPQEEVQARKQTCDILIDQVHNRGGWGYGMNSVEALAMGLVCLTELGQAYQEFIPDNPFVDITAETLEATLRSLVRHPAEVKRKKRSGRDWVIQHHDYHAAGDKLYQLYRERDWI